MLEDKLLMWKFKRGSTEALARIYEKHKGCLLTLASTLLNDVNSAEDVVHDFFVWLAQSPHRLKLDGSLKGYLATCVANRVRDKIRARGRQPVGLDKAGPISSELKGPEMSAVYGEELEALSKAIAQLPYEQWETIALHIKGGMRFRQIADLQNTSVKTVQSRYRYGLNRLRAILIARCKDEKSG
ncbi:MAG TPA: sigma-70 family RNA polymerase sigma factor [Sedimentisphaerales bacterium]|nr:sigma-70 family RNA polymerase sigma factor [Sedimentisphaerales bacterium]